MMTHKQLKEKGYRLSRLDLSVMQPYRGIRRRGTRRCVYLLFKDEQFLGSIKPLKDRPSRWGAHPALKSEPHGSRKQHVSDHKTVPEAAAALIRWQARGGGSRRPPITCPRCGSTSRVSYTLGGVQHRVCKLGHEFSYDRWMADRLIWAPGAVGSLTRMEAL